MTYTKEDLERMGWYFGIDVNKKPERKVLLRIDDIFEEYINITEEMYETGSLQDIIDNIMTNLNNTGKESGKKLTNKIKSVFRDPMGCEAIYGGTYYNKSVFNYCEINRFNFKETDYREYFASIAIESFNYQFKNDFKRDAV